MNPMPSVILFVAAAVCGAALLVVLRKVTREG